MMSKAKTNKFDSIANTTRPKVTPKQKKTKRKHWKRVEKRSSANGTIKDNPVLPPKDSQQFSVNWKTLQEVLNTKPKNLQMQQKIEKNSNKNTVQTKPLKDLPRKTADSELVQAELGETVKNGSPLTSQWKSEGLYQSECSTQKRKLNESQISVGKNIWRSNKKEVIEEADKKLTEEDIWFDDVDPDDIEATVGTEAADIVRTRLSIKKRVPVSPESVLVKGHAYNGLTKAVAMDCEMVGVGPDGEDSIVARVSLVNHFGKCVYDKFVKPTERVTDYRTEVSGIRPEDIRHGENVKNVQKEVADILKGRVLVGHAIHNDLKILLLDHPKKKIRDTQKYKPFKKIVKSGRPSLKLLCDKILHVKVQQGEHSSVQDAQATMRLYTLVKKQWEVEIKAGHKNGESKEKCKRQPKAPKNNLKEEKLI